jgi:hypothetical protein
MPEVLFDFVVFGSPHSANNRNAKSRDMWLNAVRKAARARWAKLGFQSTLGKDGAAKVEIVHYTTAHKDVDNIIKYTIDGVRIPDAYRNLVNKAKKQGRPVVGQPPFHVFEDDGIVQQVLCRRINLNGFLEVGDPTSELADALQTGREFVHVLVRSDDDAD